MKKGCLFVIVLFLMISVPSRGFFFTLQPAQASGISGTLVVGVWPQAFPYDENTIYLEGERVFLDGVVYLSLRDNNRRTPGSNGSQNFWVIEP